MAVVRGKKVPTRVRAQRSQARRAPAGEDRRQTSDQSSFLCIGCGAQFTGLTTAARIADSGYCSRKCFYDTPHRPGLTELTCSHCKTRFKGRLAGRRRPGAVFCDRQCFQAAFRKRLRGGRDPFTRTPVACSDCGRLFRALFVGSRRPGGAAYCTATCRHRAAERRRRARKPNMKCRLCRRPFYCRPDVAARSESGLLFCSYKCSSQGKRNPRAQDHYRWLGGKKSYRGANWGVQSRAARRRDQSRCRRCGIGAEGQLEVHHKRPYVLFRGDSERANALTNLQTLCHECHQAEERKFWRHHPRLEERVLRGDFVSPTPTAKCVYCRGTFNPMEGTSDRRARRKVCPTCRGPRACVGCGAEFVPRIAQSTRRYCSPGCAGVHTAPARVRVRCRRCDKTFERRASQKKTFCSRRCAALFGSQVAMQRAYLSRRSHRTPNQRQQR